MASDKLSRYIWLVDTIRRHRRITRAELDRLWEQSPLSDGRAMTRRTFFNTKSAAEEAFDIVISCDPITYEYYISDGDAHRESINNWLLNSAATNDLITTARDVASRVFLEEVPSAREHLPLVLDSLRRNTALRFDYHPYTRSLPTKGVVIEPYFTKIFNQRWYVVGRNAKEGKIKTYALDRMSNSSQLTDTFEMPADFSPAEYLKDAFGIVVDKGEVKRIRLRVEATQAKYFRALPLHPSQQEMVTDRYSIFEYRMRVTYDLIEELLKYGPQVTVIEPKSLKAAIVDSLSRSLANYSTGHCSETDARK